MPTINGSRGISPYTWPPASHNRMDTHTYGSRQDARQGFRAEPQWEFGSVELPSNSYDDYLTDAARASRSGNSSKVDDEAKAKKEAEAAAKAEETKQKEIKKLEDKIARLEKTIARNTNADNTRLDSSLTEALTELALLSQTPEDIAKVLPRMEPESPKREEVLNVIQSQEQAAAVVEILNAQADDLEPDSSEAKQLTELIGQLEEHAKGLPEKIEPTAEEKANETLSQLQEFAYQKPELSMEMTTIQGAVKLAMANAGVSDAYRLLEQYGMR